MAISGASKRMSWIGVLVLGATLGVSTEASAAVAGTLEPGKLSVGSDLTYPPYTYLDQGQPAGFDPEFMNNLGSNLGVATTFLDTRFANLIIGVNANRFDVIASALYVNPERATQVDFLPYLKSGASLMVRSADGFRPKGPEDLCGKKIGSIKGGSWIPKLQAVSRETCEAHNQPPLEVREFPTSPEAAQALLAQAVDVQIEDAAVAKITAEKLQGRIRISSRELIYPVVIGLAVRKGNNELLAELRKGFEAMKADGKYQALLTRYNLGEPTQADIDKALGK